MAAKIDIVLKPNVARGCFAQSARRFVTLSISGFNRYFFPVEMRGVERVLRSRENCEVCLEWEKEEII